jgi:hypothetical protein
MKKFIRFLSIAALLAGVFGVAATKSDTVQANAEWGNETVRVYLDKTVTNDGLTWWITDNTYINFTSDGTNYTYSAMTKINDDLFYYDILGTHWNSINGTNIGKIEFHVHNWDNPQNIVYDTNLNYLKVNEFNYFKLTSASPDTKQSYDLKNKEVEEVITSILTLDCESTMLEAQTVVDQYNALRPLGKTNLNTWEVDAGVTWYDRLAYLAAEAGATNPSSSSRYLESNQPSFTLQLVTLVGALCLSALAGFYFLKTKKQ